ncbi:MAG: response regulator transcription factor [Acidobacteriota bacterium]|nr:response regulator transcription factor [Acidobacteriota bacterium]
MDNSDPVREMTAIGPTTPRVVILEDHRLLGAALAAALEVAGFVVDTPELTDPDRVLSALKADPPQVALLDLDLGSFGSGEALLEGLVTMGARVLVVSGTTDEAVVGRCLAAGAWGWVPKSEALDDLVAAIESAAVGRRQVGDAERDRLVGVWRAERESAERALAPFARLSRREGEVLGYLAEGKSVERIAAESFVSETTVRTQVRAILTKLGVNSQLEAVAAAARAGWRPPA